MKLYFLCPLSRVSFWFSSVLFLFRFYASICFCPPCFTFSALLVFPALNVLPFSFVGFAGYFLNSYVVCPALKVFAPCVGFAGYFWFGILLARLCNVCPRFISYVLCPAVNVLPFLCGRYFLEVAGCRLKFNHNWKTAGA